MSLAIWGDVGGDHIIIGDDDCKQGDPVLIIALNQENIVAWVKALLSTLDDLDIIDVPGEMGKCSNVEEV
jgi:hypothetical protein